MRHHINVTIYFVTLIVVNIALVYAVKTHSVCEKVWTVPLTLQALTPDEEKRKNFDNHNIASCHLFSDIRLIFAYIVLYSSDYGEQDWCFACALPLSVQTHPLKPHISRMQNIELTPVFQSDASRGKEFNC